MNPPQSIAHYRIASKLGEGGMGAVYRATDTKLNRDVAIKVLPATLAADAQYMARFEREAQVLASLNHPNIAAIYGVEEGAIVMELVEGENLKGPLPVETALAYARQIAAGLEAAHEKGVIHRDLKPGNIKVTPTGTVKLLDFGLAKTGEAGATASTIASPTLSPTLSLAMTQAGMIMGTAGYMAPEQARGQRVDKRADIWAFGVVLFEMLTGKPLFAAGETVTDVIAAVVTRTPDWSLLPADTPAGVRRLLDRCLRKDLKTRLRDIGEASVILEGPLEEPAPSTVAAPIVRRSWLVWALASLIPLAAAAGWWLHTVPVAAVSARFPISPPPGTEFTQLGHSVSPDGRQLIVSAHPVGKPDNTNVLYLRSLAGAGYRELPGTTGAQGTVWSPDGKSILFTLPQDKKLRRLEMAGGAPGVLCDGDSTAGYTWSPQGTILFAGTLGPIQRIRSSGGTPVAVTALDQKRGEAGHYAPAFLPDGRFFFFAAGDMANHYSVWLGDLDGKQPPRPMTEIAGPQSMFAGGPGLDIGLILSRRGNGLMGVRFDARRRAVLSEPIPILERISDTPFGILPVAVSSPAKVMLYGDDDSPATNGLVVLDRSGKKISTITPPGELAWGHLEFSPDGRQLMGTRSSDAGVDLWNVDVARGAISRITFDGGPDKAQAWSPDGRRVFYMNMRTDAGRGMWVVAADGSGKPEKVADANGHHIGVSPDGLKLVYENRESGNQGIKVLDLSRPGKPEDLITGSATYSWPQFSPDGRWLAYISDETGRAEVYVQSFPPGRGKWQVSRSGGRLARWRRDGKELVFVEGEGKVRFYSAPVRPRDAGLEFDAPVLILETNMASRPGNHYFALSPDGQRLAMNLPASGALERSLTVMLDWMPDLAK